MLNTLDALKAHDGCKARLAAKLGSRIGCRSDNREFAPDQACVLVRFIGENAGAADLEPEISQLRAAHATVHAVAFALAQKHADGRDIDIATELAPFSNFGAASSSLVTALWRLEKKLRSLKH